VRPPVQSPYPVHPPWEWLLIEMPHEMNLAGLYIHIAANKRRIK
jgi:hypothetical protein